MFQCTCSGAIFLVVAGLLGTVSASIEQNNNYPRYKQQTRYNSIVKDPYPGSQISRKPQLVREINDCMFVTSESGPFAYVSTSDDETVCGVYFLTEPDRRVELHFIDVNVPCESYGLVSVVDGWELNAEVFPSAEDHPLPLEQRVNEFCGSKPPKAFLSYQNAALVQYRIPKRGKGFTVFARYPKNPMPCNVLAVSMTDPFTLRNYGNRVNCTYTALYPSIVEISALGVGTIDLFGSVRAIDDGILRKCNERSPGDQVQIGGSYGLDTTKLHLLDSICGMNTKSDYREIVDYGVTTVRLISSGLFNNFVTVKIEQFADETLNSGTGF